MMVEERWRPPVCALALALLVSACAGVTGAASFVRTDRRFVPKPRETMPPLFVERLPGRPYRSVGIIEVRGHGSLMDFMRAAARMGMKAGCDVVVERSLHRQRAGLVRHSTVLAQYAPYPQPYVAAHPPPPDRREFVCGVWTEASARPASPAEVPEGGSGL